MYNQLIIKMTKRVLLYFALLLWFVVPVSAQPTIFIESKEVLSNETFTVDLSVTQFPPTSGMQFSVNWEPEVIRFDSVEVEGISALPVYSTANFNVNNTAIGQLATAWTDPAATGVDIPDNARLFRLHFTAVGSLGDTALVRLSDVPIVREFISENDGMELFEPIIENGTIIVMNTTSTHNPNDPILTNPLFNIISQEPNPFTEAINISFEVFNTTELDFEVYDTQGQMVYAHRADYPPGLARILLTKTELPAIGTYIYQLKSKDFFITNRIVRVR